MRGAKVQGQNAFTFTSARKGYTMVVAESPKASDMRAKAPVLYNLEEKVAAPQMQWFPGDFFVAFCNRDYHQVHQRYGNTCHRVRGHRFPKHSMAAQLGSSSGTTSGYNNSNPGCSRLWFPVILRDFYGSTTMYITEEAALKCSRQPDAASFEEAHNEGRLCFSIVSSV